MRRIVLPFLMMCLVALALSHSPSAAGDCPVVWCKATDLSKDCPGQLNTNMAVEFEGTCGQQVTEVTCSSATPHYQYTVNFYYNGCTAQDPDATCTVVANNCCVTAGVYPITEVDGHCFRFCAPCD